MTKPIEKWATFTWPTDEEWRPVARFSGYEVSSWGRLRSCLRRNPRLKTSEIDKDGYSRVTMYRDRRYVHAVLHRLVAEAFIGPSPAGKDVCCHNDNDRSNNKPGNLRWDTQLGNIADKRIHGTHQEGSKHPRATIDEATARRVKNLLAETLRYKGRLKMVAEATGVSYHVVSHISKRNAWRCA